MRAFLNDSSSDKRQRKVEQLLSSPAYAAKWTTMLCDITGNNDQQLNNITATRTTKASQEWYDWIYKRVAENMPYDELMSGVVLATSRRPGESYYDYCVRTSKMHGKSPTASYADEPGLTYFWGRQNFDQPEERAIGFAYTFMGIRIQCAQCHKHPFDEWTQDDFTQFQAFFRPGEVLADGSDRELRGGSFEGPGRPEEGPGGCWRRSEEGGRRTTQAGRSGEGRRGCSRIGSGVLPPNKTVEKKGAKDKRQSAGKGTKVARLLNSEELIDVGAVDDPRKPLMDWLKKPENRLFARAFVNRVWAQYFHRGIVEPTDDLSLANPPSNEGLLDYLADGFVQSGYDMKWLHRTIISSDTYQRSWKPTESNRLDTRNFSHAIPRRLPAEVAVDAVQIATAGASKNEQMLAELTGRMVAYPGTGGRNGNANYALSVFGRSLRENNCDCERSMEPSLLQTLFLRNDGDVLSAIDRRDGWLAEAAKMMKVSFVPEATESAADRTAERQRLKATYEKRMSALKEELKAAQDAKDSKAVQKAERQIAAAKAKYAGMLKGESADGAAVSKESAASTKAPPATTVDFAPYVEEAYLRTLSRFPTPEESRIAQDAIRTADDPVSGLRDVLWALLNTKEFIVNH